MALVDVRSLNMARKIPNTNKITAFFQCGKCLNELPVGESPMSYARQSTGWTKLGLQIWCVRHDCNIIHIDFQGQKVAINTTIPKEKKA